MFELAAKTKKLLDLFASAPYGTTFTYGQILQATNCDLIERDRQRIYTVIRHLERYHQKTLLNLRGIGYKVAEPNQHVDSMMTRKGRASRQVALARRTGSATPLDLLDRNEVKTWSDAQAWMSRAEQILAHHDRRIERLEARMNRVDPVGKKPLEIEGTAEDVA